MEGIIIENREKIIPNPESITSTKDKDNFIKHFKNREFYENKYFKEVNLRKNQYVLKVDNIEKNKQKVISYLNKINPNLVFLFGVSVIKNEILNAMPKNLINLHSGLAPYYKGSACNFWPFYFLSPHYAGYTFHRVNKSVDTGAIIQHSLPELIPGLTTHEVSCLGLKESIKDALKIIDTYKTKKSIPSFNINNQGKFFFNSDFQPHHLRLIYDIFNDNIVDYYLENINLYKSPKLIKL